MRKLLISISTGTILSCIFIGMSIAQQDLSTFDLSDYKLPRLERHYLETNAAMDGEKRNGDYKNIYFESSPSHNSTSTSEGYNLIFAPYYRYYLNTSKLQVSQSINMDGSTFEKNKSESESEYDYNTRIDKSGGLIESRKISPQLQYSGEFREFLHNKWFISQNLIFRWKYNNTKVEHETYNQNTSEIRRQVENSFNRDVNLHGEFNVGWGRIEHVEDARLAIYIIEDLIDNGIITKEISHTDIQELAESISAVINERGFDLREKKIWELQQVDSVLKELDLIEEQNIVYFSHLNDNWDYAKGQVRKSGFQFEVGPMYNLLRHERAGDIEYTGDPISNNLPDGWYQNNGYNIGIGGHVSYEKPLNLYWQLSLNNTVYLYKDFSVTNFVRTLQDTTNSLSQSNRFLARLSYYPNTRTTVSLSNGLWYRNSNNSLDNKHGHFVYSTHISNSTGLQMEYYLSPQIRIEGSVSYIFSYQQRYQYGHRRVQYNNHMLGFNVGLLFKLV